MFLRDLLCKFSICFGLGFFLSFLMYFLALFFCLLFQHMIVDENVEEWYPASALKCYWKTRTVNPLSWSSQPEGCCWVWKDVSTSSGGKVFHNYHSRANCSFGCCLRHWSQLVTRSWMMDLCCDGFNSIVALRNITGHWFITTVSITFSLCRRKKFCCCVWEIIHTPFWFCCLNRIS